MAQDNAAQAIKDLQKNIKDLDTQLVRSQEGLAKIGELIQQSMTQAGTSIDDFIKQFRDKIGAVKGEKLRLAVEFVGKDGKKIDDAVSKLEQAINKKATQINIFGESIKGADAIKQKYQELLAMQKIMKDPTGFFDQTMAIVNKMVGTKADQGTALGKARAKEMEQVAKYTKMANEELDRQKQIESAIKNIKDRGGKSTTFEGQRMSLVKLNEELDKSRQKYEKYIRTLSGYGSRGAAAASAFGGDGYATALKNQEANFMRLNRLLNERRKLEAQIKAQGGTGTDAQVRYQKILKNAIEQTVKSMRELGKQYDGVTREAAQNTMEQRARRTQRTIDSLNSSLKKTKNNLSTMLPIVQRLASAFGIAFSVRGLVQFGKKLVETRGEFEMQFVAMKQIIGDVDAATKIWNKTMQQALQSPFKAMQLVDYTKKLAAYRIETEKLFDTTKMLADVSAGIGVDMSRLILAYGQVKTANYLRASEVRQFTEAGVNIYENLAKYFTEVEGRAVSTAEVVERVTKRMVLFSDVEEIFKRMTSEGGAFFNMQEAQADTVRGQIMKLHDAYDQMLNTIGQANSGKIRDFIEKLNELVRNWQNVAFVLRANVNMVSLFGAALFALSNKYLKDATTQTLWFSKSLLNNRKVLLKNVADVRLFSKTIGDFTLKQRLGIVATRTLQGAVGALGDVLRKVWPLLVFEGIVLLVERLTRASREMKRFREEIESVTSENVSQMNEEINGYDSLINKLKETTEGTMARKEVMEEISRRYGKYLDFVVNETTSVEQLANAYDKVVISIRNYTAEKIREEQQQRLEKGMYEDYQDLVKSLTNTKFWDNEGVMHKISKTQAQNIARIVQQSLEKYGIADIKEILATYFGDSFKYSFSTGSANQGLVNEIQSYVNQWKDMKKELDDIRDDAELATPVFATDEEYEKYKKNLEDANVALKHQDDLFQKRLDKLQEEKRATGEQWKIDDKIAELKLKNEEKILRIKKLYGLISEGQYKDELARLHGVLTTYEQDYNVRLESKMAEKFGENWKTQKKEARDMYNYVKSTEQALQQGTEQRNKQLKESYEARKESLKQLEAQLDAAEKSGASDEAKKEIKDTIDLYKAMIEALKIAAELRGIDLTSKKDKPGVTYKSISNLISVLKEMNSEYDKLSKSAYGYAKSQEKVAESYKDTFKEVFGFAGINMGSVDFTKKSGVAAAMENAIKTLDRKGLWAQFGKDGGKQARQEFMKAWSQMRAEVDIEIAEKSREDFGRELELMFSDYELTLELQKLNISPDAAKDLFPEFDSQTLGNLQDVLQDFYKKQGENFSEEDFKVYKQWSDKIEAEILKSRKERAKEYSKFLEKEYSERAKVEMQYAKDVAFVTANFQGDQQKNILKGIEDKYQKDINELTWKSFKESTFYVEMMDDLSSVPADYMKIMLEKIEELLKNPETLSPRALKEAINARQKILEAQMDIDSIAVMRESIGDISAAANRVGGSTWAETKKRLDEEQNAQAEKLKGLEEEIRCYEELQGQLKGLEERDKAVADANAALPAEERLLLYESTDIDTLIDNYSEELDSLSVSDEAATTAEKDTNVQIQARIEYLQRLIPLLEAYRSALDERVAYQETEAGQNAWFARNGGETSSSIGETITEYKEEADEVSSSLSELKKWQKAFKNFSDGMTKWNAAVAGAITKVGEMGNAFYDTFEALGGETNALTEGWKEFGNTMVQTITQALALLPQLITGFITAGTSINAAMGVVGLVAEAIQLILVAVQAFAKLHDSKYEYEIEKQQDKIDALTRAYDRLEKSIEKTWSTASYIRDYRKETQNLYEQVQALNAQMNAENSKKNADKDKIQDYEDKIQDAEDKLEELKQKQIEVFGGIGEEGYRSAAEGFVSAWKDAFLETGDGLQGLQDHFDEFLQDWFVKQATMRVTQKALEPLFREIDAAVGQYGTGGANVWSYELQNIRKKFDVVSQQLSDELEYLAGSWGIGGEGSLSGLAAGIQGMTEEQANILEAYWNGVRTDTASIAYNVANIAEILGAGGRSTNPQIQYLESIASNTGAIREILSSALTNDGNGKGFRSYAL